MAERSYLRWLLPIMIAVAPALAALPAIANPTGGKVVGGAATIQGQGTPGVIINQTTPSGIINWNSFNIGAGESTRFNQPSASSVTLNRVTGERAPSSIFGSLSANGRIFLVNPEGFIFGPTASINTAGFLATTHDIKNEDFFAGRYNFTISGNPRASIVNQGTITATDAGIAALVAPAVRNDGVITARLGRVALASANAFTLDLYGDNLIRFALNDEIASQVIDVTTGKPFKSLVENRGTLNADGGVVAMTAVTARALVDSVINNSGVVEARSVGIENGRIVLGGQTAKTKTASAPQQTVAVSGRLDASGRAENETGGGVQVTGEVIALAGTVIDVSGYRAGGTALIGGDVSGGGNLNAAVAGNPKAALETTPVPTATTVTVDAATVIDASATNNGDGGKVVVWSDGSTAFLGTIVARGGPNAGDGGFVETSGHEKLTFSGKVDLSAPKGEAGILLLDPKDVTIGSSGSWIVTVAALQAALAGNNVVVNTSATGTDAGDITVAESISWASANKLTLSANRHITVLDGVTIANTGAGSLVLHADDTGSGVGRVTFNGTGKVDFSASTGTVSIFYNPTWFSVPVFCEPPCGTPPPPHIVPIPVNYTSKVVTKAGLPNQLTAYMLVNDVEHLQYIQNALSGTYALGRDIDASATVGWNAGAGFVPIGNQSVPFSGVLDGQGHTIDQLTINSTANDVGLFGYVGANGAVRNLSLANAAVSSLVGAHFSNGTFVPVHAAALVGYNAGNVADTSVSGVVNGSFDSDIGGLVGFNEGLISKSFSIASVTGPSPLSLGGLVGRNHQGGTIAQSYANGIVTYAGSDQLMIALSFGSTGPAIGGLSGHNWGTIFESYSSSQIAYSGTGQFLTAGFPGVASAGGLVGLNFVGGVIDQSYATGPTSGGPNIVTGGLLGFNSAGFVPGTSTQVPSTTGISLSYWDVQSTGQPTSAGGTGLTTAQLKSGLPPGFNPAVWGSSPPVSNGYPHLLWLTTLPASATVLTGGPASGPVTLFFVANNATSVYGSPLPSLAGTVIGFVNGDTLATATTGTLTFTTTASSSSDVGSYPIIGSGLTAIGNYSFAQAPTNATALKITPAPLTIVADDATRPVGQANPAFTAKYSGLVLGQSPSVVSGLTITTPATPASPAGTYPIVPSGASAPNYVIGYADGVLAVTSVAPAMPPSRAEPNQVACAACAVDLNQLASLWRNYWTNLGTGIEEAQQWFAGLFATPTTPPSTTVPPVATGSTVTRTDQGTTITYSDADMQSKVDRARDTLNVASTDLNQIDARGRRYLDGTAYEQCTDLAVAFYNQISTAAISNLGPAATWYTRAPSSLNTVSAASVNLSTIPVGSILVWKGSNDASADGHVAIVIANDRTSLTVIEANYGAHNRVNTAPLSYSEVQSRQSLGRESDGTVFVKATYTLEGIILPSK